MNIPRAVPDDIYLGITNAPPSSPVFAPSATTLVSAPPTAIPVAAIPLVTQDSSAGRGVRLDDSSKLPTSAPATAIQVVTADPTNPSIGQIWYRSDTSQLCVRHDSTTTKRVTLA